VPRTTKLREERSSGDGESFSPPKQITQKGTNLLFLRNRAFKNAKSFAFLNSLQLSSS